MDYAFSAEEEAFRLDIREFYKKELPSNWHGGREILDDEAERFVVGVRRKLADRGWLTMSWPKAYGGQDAPITRQLIFAEESSYVRFQARDQGVGFLGPAIIEHGNEEQKQRFLVPISRAELVFHQGFSEPDNGSDLGGLQTKAVRDGDFYVINGRKIWGGHIDRSDYSFLLARTDPTVPKHKGISLLIIPAKTPGLTYEAFGNLGGGLQNIVYYDNCRVSIKDCLIGEENHGWQIAMSVLNHERVVVEYSAIARRLIEDLTALWRQQERSTTVDGPTLAVRHKLAEMAIEAQVCRGLVYRIAWMEGQGNHATYEASIFKVFGSELIQRLARVSMEMLGLYGQISRDGYHGRRLLLDGKAEHMYRETLGNTIMGGTSEIQRGVIANRGLDLPRS